MRRSICYCEPASAFAGEMNTWSFVYTSGASLPKGTLLKFDMLTDGRDIDWEVPSSSTRKAGNVVYAKLDNGKALQAEEIEDPERFTPQYQFVLPTKLEAGKAFTIVVGSPKDTESTKQKNGNGAQCYSQRRRPFLLHVDTTGKGRFEEPEVFSMDIKGGDLNHISIITPSYVARNRRFDVIVRFEDEFGNLTSNAPPETLIELSYEHLRENLNWKLFVPETGFITLPNLYFNETGIYTIRLLNTHTKEVYRSAPIKCFPDNDHHLYWGLLHGESERIDSTDNIDGCLRHFRDDRAFNFYASSPFENIEETPNETWRTITQNVIEFDEADRFSTFTGFQWEGEPKKEGNRIFIYTKDNKTLLRNKDAKYSSLKKIYKSFTPKELLSIPTFSMGKGTEFNFDEFNPEYERVVEIYNAWGSSECTKKEGNPFPIKNPSKKGVQEAAEGSIQKALLNNHRFGFVAGGLDDRGCYLDFFETDQEQYFPGMTAIIASEHSRSSIAEALYNRSCYATTGERIIVGLDLAGVPMGQETDSAEKPGLHMNRHLAGFVAGTSDLKMVELIRNNEVIQTYNPDGYSFDFTYDDLVPLKDVVIDNKDKKPPFVFYYLRVTQQDGHMAWGSPIWVDYLIGKPAIKKPVKGQSKTAKPVVESTSAAEISDDDE